MKPTIQTPREEMHEDDYGDWLYEQMKDDEMIEKFDILLKSGGYTNDNR